FQMSRFVVLLARSEPLLYTLGEQGLTAGNGAQQRFGPLKRGIQHGQRRELRRGLRGGCHLGRKGRRGWMRLSLLPRRVFAAAESNPQHADAHKRFSPVSSHLVMVRSPERSGQRFLWQWGCPSGNRPPRRLRPHPTPRPQRHLKDKELRARRATSTTHLAGAGSAAAHPSASGRSDFTMSSSSWALRTSLG